MEQYLLYHKGKFVYKRTYKNNSGTHSFSEGYKQIIELIQDTIYSLKTPVQFNVSLILPDSLVGGKEFYFGYQMLPINKKGSDISETTYKVKLDNGKVVPCSLTIEMSSDNLFYGHLFFEEKGRKHIFYPIEKEIILMPTSTTSAEEE